MANVHLQKLEEILQTEELTFEIGNANEQIPFPHALINIQSDTNDFEVFLVIASVVETETLEEVFESAGEYDLINILYPFPYEIEDPKYVADVCRLMHMINKITGIGTFGYDEYEHRCFFRHSLILHKTNPDYSVAKSTILLAKDVLNIYAGAIEDVSCGIVTTDALLEKFHNQIAEEQAGD